MQCSWSHIVQLVTDRAFKVHSKRSARQLSAKFEPVITCITHLHKLFVVQLHPSVASGIGAVNCISKATQHEKHEGVPLERFCQSLDNYAGSYESIECDSWRWAITIGRPRRYLGISLKWIYSYVPSSPYFRSMSVNSGGERLYPKLRRASDNSRPSIDPDWSLSKCLKTPCQSAMYFQSPENSTRRTQAC